MRLLSVISLAFGLAKAVDNLIRIELQGALIPGIIKDPAKFAAKHEVSPAFLSAQHTNGSSILETRDLDLFKRACPPTHPVPCAGGTCCQAAFPVCCTNGLTCCTTANPICCSASVGGGCCPRNFPVCQTDACCPTGTTSCGTADPGACHPAGTKCCGLRVTCPSVGAECCGTECCNTVNNVGKCCKGSTPAKSTCCGQYQVCCDGWCCYEGSSCSSTPGYCHVPQLIFGYQPGSLTVDLVENMCLGIRGQMAMGRPDTTANTQVVEYTGPGSTNRELTECRSSRTPRCCEGRTVPPGEPGEGDQATCDEYPFNSVKEGGVGAHVACVDTFANSAGGDLIRQMVNGKHEGFKYQVVIEGINCNTVTEADVHPCNPLV